MPVDMHVVLWQTSAGDVEHVHVPGFHLGVFFLHHGPDIKYRVSVVLVRSSSRSTCVAHFIFNAIYYIK